MTDSETPTPVKQPKIMTARQQIVAHILQGLLASEASQMEGSDNALTPNRLAWIRKNVTLARAFADEIMRDNG